MLKMNYSILLIKLNYTAFAKYCPDDCYCSNKKLILNNEAFKLACKNDHFEIVKLLF